MGTHCLQRSVFDPFSAGKLTHPYAPAHFTRDHGHVASPLPRLDRPARRGRRSLFEGRRDSTPCRHAVTFRFRAWQRAHPYAQARGRKAPTQSRVSGSSPADTTPASRRRVDHAPAAPDQASHVSVMLRLEHDSLRPVKHRAPWSHVPDEPSRSARTRAPSAWVARPGSGRRHPLLGLACAQERAYTTYSHGSTILDVVF